MRKLGLLLRQKEFHVLLFVVFLALVCLPFLRSDGLPDLFSQENFLYFFVVWALTIGLLWLMSRHLKSDAPPRSD